MMIAPWTVPTGSVGDSKGPDPPLCKVTHTTNAMGIARERRRHTPPPQAATLAARVLYRSAGRASMLITV